MKTIGLLGGMSYESTLEYYRMINKKINKGFFTLTYFDAPVPPMAASIWAIIWAVLKCL